MNLITIASAFPNQRFTQQQCLDAMREAYFWPELKPGFRYLLEKILNGNSGISERRFSMNNLTDAWKRDPQQLNEYYEKEAPVLAELAAIKALDKSNLNIKDIDAIFICSCTGYLCPGLSSYVAECLGMNEDAYLQDLTGLGCGAAIPMLEAAAGYLSLHPESNVLTIAVEVCSAAFYVENDPGVLISTCIFGDGASAALWSGKRQKQIRWKIDHFKSLHSPEHREMIRFTNAQGKLRNQLHRDVPRLAANTVKKLYEERHTEDVAIVTHGGGREVITALEKSLNIDKLHYARAVMQQYGNLSSPSVLVALEMLLNQPLKNSEAQTIWMCSFGAGFSAHSCELKST